MGSPDIPGRTSGPDLPADAGLVAKGGPGRDPEGETNSGAREAETGAWNPSDEAPVLPPSSPAPDAEKPEGAGRGAKSPALDLEQVVASMAEVGLLGADEVRSFLARFPEPDRPREAGHLVRELVRARRLTDYQAGAILQGKTKGLLIGNYRILDKIGAGGMGMVFKAEHRLMKRIVALKLLPPSFTRDPLFVLRFRREAEAVARLSHPNVVAALDAGEFKGLHFFAMEYVEGRNLDRLVKEKGPMSVDQALDCLIQSARGLQAAHARGILHRDIKPLNLLLDPVGTVKVLDLGLARIERDSALGDPATADEALTRHGDVMGTVEYMSPEQAFDSRSVDGRSDIYSLGCTLYYLLAGKPPYPRDASILACALAHRERSIPSLRDARPEVPPALDGAYRRMMAKKPQDRYPTIDALIDSLEACRSAIASPGLEPPASPPRARTPRAWLATGAAVAALALAFALIAIGLVRPRPRPGTRPSPAVAPDVSTIVVPARRDVPSPERVERVPGSNSDVEVSRPAAVAEAKTEARSEHAARKGLASIGPIVEARRFLSHGGRPAESVAIARDGRHALSAGDDQTVRYWKVADGEEVRGFRHDGPVYAAAFSPDGRTFVSASGDKTARIWEVESGREVVRFPGHHQAVYAAAFSPDGRHALTGGRDKTARLWDAMTGSEVRTFPHAGIVVALAFSPSGRSALTASNKTLSLWDVETGTTTFKLEGYADVLCVAFSSDGHRGLSGASDGALTLWDLDRHSLLRRIEEPGNWVRCAGFLPDDRHALAGTQNGNLILWDIEGSWPPRSFPGKAGHLGLAIVPDGRQAMTADLDGSIRLWTLTDDL